MRAGTDSGVSTDDGGWELGTLNEREATYWTKARWDCYLAVAQHLLATPIPELDRVTEEQPGVSHQQRPGAIPVEPD